MREFLDFMSSHQGMAVTVTCGVVLLAYIHSLVRNRRLFQELITSRNAATEDRRSSQAMAQELKENIRDLKNESRHLADLTFKLPALMRQFTVDLDRRSQGPLLLRVMEEMFAPTQAMVFLADDYGESLTLVAKHGLDDSTVEVGVQIAVGEGQVGFAARKQLVMDSHDFRLESNLDRERIRKTSLPGVKADLCAPLISNGRLLGAISMGTPRKWASVELKRLFGMVADVGALSIASHLQYREIQQLANSDPLTRIANKSYFMTKAEEILNQARGESSETAILMIDVDHFKQFNDTYGHLAGDRVLRGIGQILKQHVREGDVAARFGGEEFIVILRAADSETAARVAERIRTEIRTAEFGGLLTGGTRCVTASIGVGVYPQDASLLGDLINMADQALYRAKEAGRDRVHWAGMPDPEAESAKGAAEDPEVEEEESSFDILGALGSAMPIGYDDSYDDRFDREDEDGEEPSVPPLSTTVFDMS